VAIAFKDVSKKHAKKIRDHILDLLVGDIMGEQDNIFKIDQPKESNSP